MSLKVLQETYRAILFGIWAFLSEFVVQIV